MNIEVPNPADLARDAETDYRDCKQALDRAERYGAGRYVRPLARTGLAWIRRAVALEPRRLELLKALEVAAELDAHPATCDRCTRRPFRNEVSQYETYYALKTKARELREAALAKAEETS